MDLTTRMWIQEATLRTPESPHLVVIADIGSEAAYHVGDEAMLDANLTRLRRRIAGIQFTLISADPAYSSALYHANAAAPIGFADSDDPNGMDNNALLKAAVDLARRRATGTALTQADSSVGRIVNLIDGSDGVLISGGGNLSSTWPHHLYERAAAIQIAYALGKPVAITGQTIGPNLSDAHRQILGEALSLVSLLAVRELDSYQLALTLGVPPDRLEYHVDDAMFLEPEPLEGVFDGRRPFAAVTVHRFARLDEEDEALSRLAGELEQISDHTGLDLVFVPHVAQYAGEEVFSDVRIGRKLANFMRDPDRMRVLSVENGRRVAWLTQSAALVISTRYHPLVFGLGGGVPCLGISTDEYTRVKLQGALQHAGLQRWTLAIEAALSGGLYKTAVELWEGRDEIIRALSAHTKLWRLLDTRFEQRLIEALELEADSDDRMVQEDSLQQLLGVSAAPVRPIRQPRSGHQRHSEPGRREVTSEYWDKKVQDVEEHVLRGWLDWDIVEEEYVRPQISGDSKVHYLEHFVRNYIGPAPVERALSLGCGGGNLERTLISMNAAKSIDAFDVSVESIRIANELAAKAGMQDRISYEARDINKLVLPANTYDFVIVKMALHHFERLEHVYEQIALSLKPDGVLVFNDFIGPSRYQWTDKQIELMNGLLRTLPKRHTWSALAQDYVQTLGRPSVTEMVNMDPSEAVRSGEIMSKLGETFDIVENKPYGGTLLHILLNHIITTFDFSDPDDVSLLRTLFLYEQTLIKHGVIGSDFAYVVARPKREFRQGTENRPIVRPAVPRVQVTADEARAKIAKFTQWYHRIEIFPGVVTPGMGDSELHRKRFDELGMPLDARGMRVLDIGCADGYFSFLMEKRGAEEVVAIDYRRAEDSGFAIASNLLGSKVKYYVENVYGLSPEKYGLFDVVLFFGVLYHLRNPLLGLDRIRQMMNPQGVMFLESQIIDRATLMPDGSFKALTDFSPQLAALPLWQFYSRDSLHKDATTKWAPNLTGLKQIVEEAQFRVTDSTVYGARGGLRAEPVFDEKLEYFRTLDAGS